MEDESEPQALQYLRAQERNLESKIRAWEALDWTGREALAKLSLARLKDQLERINLEIIKLL